MTALEELAGRYRIVSEYHGIDGILHRPPEGTLTKLLAAFGVAAGSPEELTASLAAAPNRPPPRLVAPEGRSCYLPSWLEAGRGWGVAVHLYQLRSERNWGIGDFADLARLARIAGDEGADFIGLNPLHALFLADPSRVSPFSPSNRRYLNPVYIAPDALPLEPSAIDRDLLASLRAAPLVDYEAVVALKREALFAIWRRDGGDTEEFLRFRAAGGEALERHARFEAISAQMVANGRGAGWLGWPPAWQDPESPEVTAFAESRSEEIGFHAWLQWLADRQLGEARDAALEAGMRIGLYLDFAVGEAPDGSGTWSDRAVSLPGMRIGAPPDYFSVAGQNWNLSPLSPVGAGEDATPFRKLMDNATSRAGALRIDHAMALWQLFLIPENASAAEGTYVRYPMDAMIAALADASQSHRTIIIGEDLGNVPEGFRDVMDVARILSYRILLFERDGAAFIPPDRYPKNALVCLSTHDLPTFQGWWQRDDVDLRLTHGLIDAEAAAHQSGSRAEERSALLRALAGAGFLSGEETTDGKEAAPELVAAVHRYLARTPSRLLAVRLEDALGAREPVNLPGTVDEYPNWRRKLTVPLEAMPGIPLWRDIASGMRAERPREDAP